MSRILTPLLIGAAGLTAMPAEARRDSPDVQLQKLIGDRVAGAPVDCINLTNTHSSTVIDGRAIVYRVGSRLYVNVPRSGADSLDDDDILVTRTHTTQLCSRDTIDLGSRNGRIPHGFVLLGEFVPYARPKH